MADEPEQKEDQSEADDSFAITFKNGALKRLKKVAQDLGVPEDRLGDVLTKGIVLMDIAKDGYTIVVKKGGEEYVIDLRRL